MSSGTNMKEAQENMLLAETILNSKELECDKYEVPGHGVVTLDRKKGRQFIGNKLSHMRKPSAYKGKTNRVCAISVTFSAVPPMNFKRAVN